MKENYTKEELQEEVRKILEHMRHAEGRLGGCRGRQMRETIMVARLQVAKEYELHDYVN